jgi:hypothetical protein
MNQTLKEAKQTIRKFIQQHWSDQKLVEVYAFNADGKMTFDHCCDCIRGVTLADTLHCSSKDCDSLGILPDHYIKAGFLEGAGETESAYRKLGYVNLRITYPSGNDSLRQRRLSAILRAEIRLRSRRQLGQPGSLPRPVVEKHAVNALTGAIG